MKNALSLRMCVCVCTGHEIPGRIKRALLGLFLMPIFLLPTVHSQSCFLQDPSIYGDYEDNPGTFHIRPAILAFYNLQGKLMLKQSFPEGRHTIHWPKERFRPGLYLAEITFSSGQRERFKLILTQ